VIGDGVYVAPHAAVLGQITVGDGARISASSVVTWDVPEHWHVWPAPVIITPGVGEPADCATAEGADA
jgi:serine acetyltransferase